MGEPTLVIRCLAHRCPAHVECIVTEYDGAAVLAARVAGDKASALRQDLVQVLVKHGVNLTVQPQASPVPKSDVGDGEVFGGKG